MAKDNMYRLLTGKVEEKKLEEVKDLSPTVIIGLGGTGKEVMLRLRKKFFEKYGSLGAFPIVSYIFIDTDTTNKFLTTEARDIISPQIEFEQDEVVDASIESTSKYTDNLDNYPHIKKWFYPQLKALGDLREGAGQIRPYGRLGFFHRFDVISDKIRRACQRVTNPANHKTMLEKYGVNVNLSNVNIYILSSLAGGTGSGMFLDVAFLVKHLQQNVRTVGFLVLPRIFGDVPRCDANGYSALMELDYYSYGHHFEVEWTSKEPLTIPPPPFDYCYLIDGVNETGMTISDRDKARIFELLSDNIFIDFSMSDFAAFKRGVRINLAQYLQDMFAYVHYTPDGKEIMTESFPCKYFSFGLSSIGFPLDRVKNACAYKLALDIANHWVKLAKGARPTLALREKVLKEFLPEIGLLEGSLGHTVQHDITDTLYKRGEFGETFRRMINSWAMGVRKEVNNNIPRVEKMGWKQFISNEIDKHRLLYKEDVDPDNCGENIRIMNDNKTEFLNNVKKKLDSKIAEMAGNPFEGVGYCLEILKEIGIILTTKEFNYIPRFESEQKILEGKLRVLKKKYEDILDEIGIIEEEFWKINPQRKIALDFYLSRLIEVINSYFWTLIQFRARRLAIEICYEILEYLGVQPKEEEEEIGARGKANDLVKLYTRISNLESEFKKKYDYYIEPIENPLKIAIYEKSDIDQKYYSQYMGKEKQQRENNIHGHSQIVLDSLKVDLMKLPGLIEKVGLEEVGKRIVEVTKKPFERLGEDFNILDMFSIQRGTEGGFTEQMGKSQIRNALAGAQPWLCKDKNLAMFNLALHKQRCFVGGHELTSDSTNPKAKNFMEWVGSQQPANAPHIAFYETLDKNEILFYTEIAGFPIAYSDIIRHLRTQYKKLIDQNTELHIDSTYYKFNDLLMLTPKEREKLEEAQESFLLGIILGIVEPKLDKHEKKPVYMYRMQLTITTFEDQWLGFEDKAVSTLFERDDVRESIKKRIEEETLKLSTANKLVHLDALCSWYLDHIYKSEEIELSGGERETKSPPERLILIKWIKRIEEGITDEQSEEFTEKIKELNKNIDTISKKVCDKRVLEIS